MALRRSHHKSRNGCLGCKRRRVKCDEAKPSCSNCSKRHIQCKYDSSSWIISANPQRDICMSSNNLLGPKLNCMCRGKPHDLPNRQCDAPESSASHDPQASSSVSPLDLQDLELIMQWNHDTHRVFACNGRTSMVWSKIVPQEALSHPFLMHGILALSALHLSQKDPQPSRRPMHLLSATKHHKEALGLFYKQLANCKMGSPHAMFAFGSIVVAYSFGFPLTPNIQDPIHSIDEIHRVLSLSNSVYQAISMLQGGCDEMASVSVIQREETSTELPKDIALAIDNIRIANRTCGKENSSHNTKIYDETINKVADMLCSVYGGTKSSALLCQRVAQIPRQYLDFVQKRDQMALVILTHMCIPLYHLKHFCHFDKWCSRVANTTSCMLEDRWRPLVNRAMAIIIGKDGLESSNSH